MTQDNSAGGARPDSAATEQPVTPGLPWPRVTYGVGGVQGRPAAPAGQSAAKPPGPAPELIEMLPQMLRGQPDGEVSDPEPFATMPETMPPPPLRPILPPEQQAAPVRRGWIARLFGGAR
jgi:hypothetical protein